MTVTLSLPDPEATVALANRLVDLLPKAPRGWRILLQGELGSGKSTLARAMLQEFGHKGAVPSPTYTLVEPYTFTDFSVYHIDLYRITGLEELEYLGWSDLEEGLQLIEWPEQVPGLEDGADVRISLAYADTGRVVRVDSCSDRGAELLLPLNSWPGSFSN